MANSTVAQTIRIANTQRHTDRDYTCRDANAKRDRRIFEVKTLLNRQNYPKKRLLSDKIAHSGISRDYYCKKFHF